MDGQAYYDSRDRRNESQQAPAYQQQPQHQQQPSHQSPPHSASPFAFAPPPLSSAPGSNAQRPQPVHHQQSDPLPSGQYQSSYYVNRPAQPVHASSFPASVPMAGYRSHSNESPVAPGRASPAPISRTASMNFSGGAAQSGGPVPAQPSPGPAYAYANGPGAAGNRSTSGAYASHSPSSRPAPYPHPSYHSHPQYSYPSSAAPSSVEMPRSLSYPNYSQSYATYMPGQAPGGYPPHLQGSHPGLPPLMRHTSTSTIGEGVNNMDINRSGMGYSFANRLPLVDRPFKCDECVQSFNRNHDLKRHKRIHLQVKPFGCDKCGKTFSRKDALRRHWLVKGCRGEDGATAPILPLYPLNSQPPALSPPTPPHATTSSNEDNGPFSSGALSFSHPSAPPPLGSLPPRQHNESSSTLLVTPNDVTSAQPNIVSLDEPVNIHPSHRASESSTESYFEAAQNSVMMEKSRSSSSQHASPYASRFPSSAGQGLHHPYRRPSPQRTQTESPTYAAHHHDQRMVSSNMNGDGKPVFATSFNGQYEQNGMLAPGDGVKMEKQLSQMSQMSDNESATWQRWHRPSFPFPPPSGINYNYQQPSSPADLQQPQQAYA